MENKGSIMKRLVIGAIFALVLSSVFLRAQSSADSVTVTFRADEPSGTTIYVPGEFNGWTISAGSASQMTYSSNLAAWIKTLAFKRRDATDTRRRLGDSVFQYKFNRGGLGGSAWYSDPLNPERNPADNNNSVLRLPVKGWFEVSARGSLNLVTRVSAGIIHTNDLSVDSIRLETGDTQEFITRDSIVTSAFDPTLRVLDVAISPALQKSNFIRLTAYFSDGDSIVHQQGGYVIVTADVPAGVRNGVTLPAVQGDSTAFRLSVPAKQLVLLRIAPLGTHPSTQPAVVLRRSSDNRDWWTRLLLSPGTYEYYYELEAGKQIFDPWGRWNGTNGTRFSVGPEGLTADDYVWQSTTYARPPLNRLVIYELNVTEFAGPYVGKTPGNVTFTDMITVLPHLDSLGINAIELMPINDFGLVGISGFSWGYDINHHFALEPSYGTPRQFKQFVDAAHARGIAVIVDVVFNHLNETGPLWEMLPSESSNPYFKPAGTWRYNEDQLIFFKDLDHWSDYTQEYVYQSLKMFLDEYKVDGFRFDYTQGIGWSISEPTKGILGWINRISAEHPDAYYIAEHLPESPALVYYSAMTGGWHDSFHDKIFDEARYANVSLFELEDLVLDLGAFPGNDTPSTPNRYANRTEPVNANVNHDEQSLIYEMVRFQGVPEDIAVTRDKLYAVYMFTSLGIPMLWEGMEWSEPRGWGAPGHPDKLAYRPVQWAYLTAARGKTHFEYYRTLILQRRMNPALYRGQLHKLWSYTTERAQVWGFEDTETDAKVMVVANLSSASRTLSNVPWLSSATWYDVFTQQAMPGASPLAELTIPAYSAKVFSNKTNEELGIVTSVSGNERDIPKDFALQNPFPNPFNPAVSIKYQVPRETHVIVAIYDNLGRQIEVLENSNKSPGYYSVIWNPELTGRNTGSGVYFVRVIAGAFTSTRKIIFLK